MDREQEELEELEKIADFKEYYDEKEQVRFAYPKNWFVQESLWSSDVKAIILNTPEGYFWLLAIYPQGTNPDTAAKEVLKTMQSEYKDLEASPARRIIAGRHLKGYEMNFFYLDLVNTALVLGLEENNRTYVVFWQNCDRLVLDNQPFDHEDVFQTVTHTFLTNLQELAEKDE